jgi:hypothetical protein
MVITAIFKPLSPGLYHSQRLLLSTPPIANLEGGENLQAVIFPGQPRRSFQAVRMSTRPCRQTLFAPDRIMAWITCSSSNIDSPITYT